ncbi:hypothetical protein RHMOL_Rhmol09G0067800 [Rhododendron molle]|uniref:Uncharacterized protein n=1 Tax=Rhododendron molle TaxID=49168 RepID=A0ACC0MAM7_RHOML|nr:hypothetical protein RHMOL_Rhmol09G0067800 [Rhododendron molle]
MEGANCLFDLPAYRVVLKLFVALNDLPRIVRYFSKLKEAGFSPTYDIYRNLFTIYMVSGRVAKCKEVCKEVEMAGFVLDKKIKSQLLQLESLARGQPPSGGGLNIERELHTPLTTDCRRPLSIRVNREQEGGDNIVWDPDEIEAISSLFKGRIPQKPGKLLNRERPLPLQLPTKSRPIVFPTPKKHVRMTSSVAVSSRQTFSKRVYKNPSFLVDLAKEIRKLPSDEDVSTVFNKWSAFLRKGSLSLTVRELGHMGLPKRALETFNWARTQPPLS